MRTRAFRALCGITLAFGCALEGHAATITLSSDPPRHALVVGNSRYQTVSVLPNVANDLDDMCATLTRLRFKTSCLRDVPSRDAFIEAIGTFVASVPPGASVLFYYGGHAVQVSGENYLIPTQVDGDHEQGWLPQFVRLSEVFQLTEGMQAGFQFMVLDACRDNPDVPDTPITAKAGTSQLRSMMSAVRSGGRFATYGIAAVRDAPFNTLVLFATGAGNYAFDGEGERNGPLTKHLLIQIQRPRLSVDQVVKNVIQQVGDDTERRFRQRQSPSLYGTYTGEFCFDGCPQMVSLQKLEEERRRAQEVLRRSEHERRESMVVPSL
jgi:uncharacterized caspase-like protein